MTDADRVLALFAEINPVAGQLRHEGGTDMSDVTIKHPDTEPDQLTPSPYRRIVLVAAVVVAVVAGAVLLQTRATDDVADGSADALAVFEGAMAAFDADDIDGFMAAVAPDGRLFTVPVATDPEAVTDLQWFYATLERSSTFTCEANGPSVRCQGTVDNVLLDAAGVDTAVVLTGTVTDGKITTMGYSGFDVNGYVDLVATWIAQTQPDVWTERFTECFAETNCFRTDGASFLMNAASAQAIVDHVTTVDDGSVAVATEFFEQLDAGDDAAAMSQVSPGVVAEDNWGSVDLAAEAALGAGQGTAYVEVSCGTLASGGGSSLVVCEYGTADALVQALDGPVVPSRAGVAVSDGEIEAITFRYREPDFGNARLPFERWMEEHRPDVTCLAGYLGDCADPTTTDGWRETGTQVATYAAEWAEWLRTNGCTTSEQGRGFGICSG